MSAGSGSGRGWSTRWAGQLSIPALAVLGTVILAGVGAGGYYAYRTYDFVEHDNRFCLSCHLMVDPYERFARSAHRDLGCKDCHRPTLVERGRMGVTQFLENPEEIGAHASVPNEVCADCHVEGEPERWAQIANTAGHRVHLESDDPVLEGLGCVECHSTSVHEFAPSDATCAQSGCHTASEIRLGAMSDLTIHCAACHRFVAPVEEGGAAADGAAALAALSPDAGTCLSCHAMQDRVAMPADDPHRGACASCHDPHVQATPAEAAGSCTGAGCHEEPSALTPFHRGLDEDVAGDCLSCHRAHGFRVDGSDCLACHTDLLAEGGTHASPAVHAVDRPPEPLLVHAIAAHRASTAPAIAREPVNRVSAASRAPAPTPAAGGPPTLQERPPFDHAPHRAVPCLECHADGPTHGAVTVTTVTDCRNCHHTTLLADDCVACHREPGAGAPPEVTRTLLLSVGVRPGRVLPFDHGAHAGVSCSTCHEAGPDRSAEEADCATCHAEHHRAENDCASCHTPAAPGAHRPGTAHVGCGGAGCHQDLPFERVERTRSVCLVCHQDLHDHRPDGDCAECHALTGPGFGVTAP